MSTAALYDVLSSFKDIHKVVLNLVADLNDEQLSWKPDGYSTSIGFHLWHLGRESDYLKAALLRTIRNLFPSLVMEKRLGKRKILPGPGVFRKGYIKRLEPV